MNITTVGLDLAKNVFQVHAIDETGEIIVCNASANAEPCRIEGDLLFLSRTRFWRLEALKTCTHSDVLQKYVTH